MKKLLLLIVILVFACNENDSPTDENDSVLICDTFPDINGNIYKAVQIGEQCWTQKNAENTSYADGTPIPQVQNPSEWSNLTTGAWCYYNNDSSNGKNYGLLYNWYAIAGIHDNDPNTPNKEFAPDGWRVSTSADWDALENYLSNNGYSFCGDCWNYGALAKSLASQSNLWNTKRENGESFVEGAIGNNLDLNNSTGFSALPSGFRSPNGEFHNVHILTNIYAYEGQNNSLRNLGSQGFQVRKIESTEFNKPQGNSVRFVRN